MEKVIEWQPISTFDKKQKLNKNFLLWDEEQGSHVVCWMDLDERWYLDTDYDFKLTQEALTHWMDLPEPPK